VLLSGTVFIDRKNNKSAIASMTQAGEDMKRKRVSGACDESCSEAYVHHLSLTKVDIPVDLPRGHSAPLAPRGPPPIQEGRVLPCGAM
jgi:hypothetical protein